jgi:hypothetical protein
MTRRIQNRLALAKLSTRKKAELRLIAELTFDATLAAESKLSKLAERVRKSSGSAV